MACCLTGREASFEVSSDGGTVWRRVGDMNSYSLSMSVDEIECTSMDDLVKRYKQGLTDVTISFEGHKCGVDAGQNILHKSFFDKTTFRGRIRWEQLSGATIYEFEGFLSSLDEGASTGDITNFSGSIRTSSFTADIQT